MIFWDRSRAQTDDTCERSRYYLTGYKGRGIAPVQSSRMVSATPR